MVRTKTEELEKKLQSSESTIQWLNKNLTTAQARDPSLKFAPPPQGVHFSPSAMASTSTPMPRTHTPTSSKENRNPGLDPKYLQPSPTLANNSRQQQSTRNRIGRGGAASSKTGGIRPASAASIASAGQYVNTTPPPQS